MNEGCVLADRSLSLVVSIRMIEDSMALTALTRGHASTCRYGPRTSPLVQPHRLARSVSRHAEWVVDAGLQASWDVVHL